MEASKSIVEWYKNQTIFLTGGSGYIGKGIIFKLLQCGAPKIYILIRTKRGQNPQERLDIVANNSIYDTLRAKGIDVRSKLLPIAGDITIPQLGISEKDRLLLQEEVTVVLHTAASVKFDDPLKTAIFYNLRSARDLAELAKGMKKLRMLHHVSTAFCNFEEQNNSRTVMEKIYSAKMDWKKLIEFVETTPDELINAIEMKTIDQHTNSYFFTKHLAENVFEEAAQFIPVSISRPAIVMCSEREPEPGWTDSNASALMITAGIGKGVIHVIPGYQTSSPKAYTTLDTVVNTALVSTWDQAIAKKSIADGQVKVFNAECTPLTMQSVLDIGAELFTVNPLSNAIWRSKQHTVPTFNLFLFFHLIEHVLPALFFDTLLKLSGNKPRLIKTYRKIYVAMMSLYPIVLVEDKFDITNLNNLKLRIPDNERETFELNIPKTREHILKYIIQGMNGIRKFLGDPPAASPKDFIHQKRLYWLDVALQAVLALLFLWLTPFHLLAVPFFYIADSFLNLFE